MAVDYLSRAVLFCLIWSDIQFYPFTFPVIQRNDFDFNLFFLVFGYRENIGKASNRKESVMS